MKKTFENKKKLTAWIIGIAAACILIFLGVRYIDAVSNAFSWCVGIVMPLIIGCAIAMIINVPMAFLETHLWKNSKNVFLCKVRRVVAFLLSLILIIGIFAGIIIIVVPTLVESVTVIVQSVIEIADRINSTSKEEVEELPFGELLADIDWSHLLDTMKSWLKNQAKTIVNTVFGTISSIVVAVIDLFVSVIFAVYILFSKEKLKDQARRMVKAWLPQKRGEWLCHAISVANTNFRNFIVAQSLEAVILGVLCLLGMLLFQFPYAAMISTLVGVTALIPVVGGFIGGGIGAFMILTVDPIKALWFIVYIIILQQIEGNLIYPKVMGDRVNLSAMWILVAVTIGAGVAGPVGILVSVPLLSTICVLFEEATQKREARLFPQIESDDQCPEPPDTPPAATEELTVPDTEVSEVKEKNKSAAKNKEQKIKRKKK